MKDRRIEIEDKDTMKNDSDLFVFALVLSVCVFLLGRHNRLPICLLLGFKVFYATYNVVVSELQSW